MNLVHYKSGVFLYTFSYDDETGTFTVPIGSGGLYFLSTHMVVDDKKYGAFTMRKNTEILCGFFEENTNSTGEDGTGSCSATAHLSAGKNRQIAGVWKTIWSKPQTALRCTQTSESDVAFLNHFLTHWSESGSDFI